MIRRLIFAAVVTCVFLASLFASWLWGTLVTISIVAAVAIPLILFRGNPAVGHWLNRILGPFLRTNNRWLVTVLTMVIISFWLAFMTEGGSPYIQNEAGKMMNEPAAVELRDLRQKYYNLYGGRGFKTDTQVGRGKQVPEYREWRPWNTRWINSWILLVLFGGYIPFALSDEARRAYLTADRRWYEQTGGSAGEPFSRALLRRMLREPVNPPRTTPPTRSEPPAAAGTGHSYGWIFLSSMLAETIGQLWHPRP